MSGGWSGYVQNAKKKHYFEKDDGKSVCGMVVLSEVRYKHKFIKDSIDSYNEKVVCILCKREYKRRKGIYVNNIDSRSNGHKSI